jgi:hypothetical protein
MATNPTLLAMPLAKDGDKSTIPKTAGSTTGDFSQQYGFSKSISFRLVLVAFRPSATISMAHSISSAVLLFTLKKDGFLSMIQHRITTKGV